MGEQNERARKGIDEMMMPSKNAVTGLTDWNFIILLVLIIKGMHF